jgi:hypothetical protein
MVTACAFMSAWEAEFSFLYFQHLQNRLEKMCVHALHAVHALPDLRVAGDVWGTVYHFWLVLKESPRRGRSSREASQTVVHYARSSMRRNGHAPRFGLR